MKALSIVLAIAAVLAGVFWFQSQETTANTHKITLSGSSTIAPVMTVLANLYERKNPAVRIDVQAGGSSRGISDARSGLADIGLVSRSLKGDESDLSENTFAVDGIAIIVHQNNPITELSNEQITEIFKGNIKSWHTVGANKESIVVVNKAEGRSTLELFLKYFDLANNDIKADIIIGDNEQGIKTVAGNPLSIGYVSIGAAEYSVEQNIPIKLLPLNAIKASTENIRNGTFPIYRALNLVTKSTPSGHVKQFIQFSYSEEAKKIIEQFYFIPAQG